MKVRLVTQVFLIVTCFTLVSLAQVQTLDQAKYTATRKAAFEATEKKNRRVITTIVTFDEGKRTGTETLTEEFLPPDTQRSILVERAGTKMTRTEIIDIGDAEYRRVDAGIWAKWRRINKPKSKLAGVPSINEPKEIIKYTLADKRLNGKIVTILSRVSNKAYGFMPGRQVERIWISKDGFVLKTEEIVSEDDADNIVEKSVATYLFDPKGLKIEAPIK